MLHCQKTRALLVTAAACAAAIAGATQTPAQATPYANTDVAVVVGVNRYPNLAPASQLNGCVNDANTIAERLRRYGFRHIIRLNDAQATHDNILQAIQGSRNARRLVFYFAGHGSNEGGTASILPYDANGKNAGSDITAQQLNAALKSAGAKSKTVILDSCFCGAMANAAKSLHSGGRIRYVSRRLSSNKAAITRATGRYPSGAKNIAFADDAAQPGTDANSGVCYVTAAGSGQPASEVAAADGAHGLFSLNLTLQLNGKKMTWQNVIQRVNEAMDEAPVGHVQKAAVSDTYAAQPVLNAGDGDALPSNTPQANAPQDKAPQTLLDVYFTDQYKGAELNLSITPNGNPMPINQQFSIGADIGREGYLIVLEHGTDGKYALLYPREPQAASAQVKAGQPLDLGRFFANEAGTEDVSAILFSDQNDAAQLLGAFTAKDPATKTYTLPGSEFKRQLRRKTRRLVRAEDASRFVTSRLVFQVGNPAGASETPNAQMAGDETSKSIYRRHPHAQSR